MALRILRLLKFNYLGPTDSLSAASDLSYDQLKAKLENSGFLYGNGLAKAFNELGCEADQIYADSDVLQSKWAKEHGLPFQTQQDRTQIVLKQIAAYKPEIIYFQDDHALPHETRAELKKMYPFIKLVLMFKGFPQNLERIGDVDHLFAGVPDLHLKAKQLGLSAELMYHSFDSQMLQKLSPKQGLYGATFVGSSGIGYGTHRKRYWTLFELLLRTPMIAWLDEPGARKPFFNRPHFDKLATRLLNESELALLTVPSSVLRRVACSKKVPSILRKLASRSDERRIEESLIREIGAKNRDLPRPRTGLRYLFPEKVSSSVFGMEMYRIINESLVTFNIHTEAVTNVSGNMRMFEATGVGSCLLTNATNNNKYLFDVDTEIVTYENREDCVEKMKYLVDHPDKAREIGRRGQERTLRSHTNRVRAEQILSHIRKNI